jgi:hypothetical protein
MQPDPVLIADAKGWLVKAANDLRGREGLATREAMAQHESLFQSKTTSFCRTTSINSLALFFASSWLRQLTATR